MDRCGAPCGRGIRLRRAGPVRGRPCPVRDETRPCEGCIRRPADSARAACSWWPRASSRLPKSAWNLRLIRLEAARQGIIVRGLVVVSQFLEVFTRCSDRAIHDGGRAVRPVRSSRSPRSAAVGPAGHCPGFQRPGETGERAPSRGGTATSASSSRSGSPMLQKTCPSVTSAMRLSGSSLRARRNSAAASVSRWRAWWTLARLIRAAASWGSRRMASR